MKAFESIEFDANQCRRELNDFGKLLTSNQALLERNQIKPFFDRSRQLSAFVGTFVPDIGPAKLLAYEFEIAGDFAADIVVGNRETQTFCMVELEGAGQHAIFASGGRSTKTWSRQLEQGFSQLVDWFYALEDLQGSVKLAKEFGYGHTKFHGLLVIGRSAELSESDRHRLRWREERVLINSHPIHCVTYDELLHLLVRRLEVYSAAPEKGDQSK